jgi:hypothetical protein
MRTICILSILLVATSCDWKSDGAGRMAELYPEPSVDVQTEDTPPESDTIVTIDIGGGSDISLADLDGAWAMEMKLPGTMELFPGFPPYALKLTNRFVVEISADKASLTFCHQIAFLDADGTGATEMIPDTEDAIGKESIILMLAEGIGITAQKVVWTWGLKEMANPETDPLPENPEDPIVWDQDDDDHPGVSINVSNPTGIRYMVRRGIWNLQPPAINQVGDHMTGTLTFQVHEGAVGYDGPKTLKTIIPIVSDPGGGTYQLVRNDGSITCQQLRQDNPGVFK